VERKSGVGV